MVQRLHTISRVLWRALFLLQQIATVLDKATVALDRVTAAADEQAGLGAPARGDKYLLKGLRPATEKCYLQSLDNFATWLDSHRCDPRSPSQTSPGLRSPAENDVRDVG